ncbi:MAG: hypothetical protein QOF94_2516 [Acidobacteriaceae bacterium]|jgi:RNA polymerase sigma factor (TIGR02999 family)
MSDLTHLLNARQNGDPAAAEELLRLVYDELRKVAASKMAKEAPGHTLQPTALVHEAWLRLVGNAAPRWDGRAHFFAAAAEAMRRILIESARRKRALRHGGTLQRVDLEEAEVVAPSTEDELWAVNDALEKLSAEDPQLAELVKLRFFVGLTNKETAGVLGIAEPTAERWWAFSRAWLREEIRPSKEPRKEGGESKNTTDGTSLKGRPTQR